MKTTKWLILFFGSSLSCDSSILEALYAVLHFQTAKDIWLRLSDECNLDTFQEEFQSIVKSMPCWSSVLDKQSMDKNVISFAWYPEKFTCNDRRSSIYLVEKTNTIEIIEDCEQLSNTLQLVYDRISKVLLHAFVGWATTPINIGHELVGLSLKEQILKANRIVSAVLNRNSQNPQVANRELRKASLLTLPSDMK